MNGLLYRNYTMLCMNGIASLTACATGVAQAQVSSDPATRQQEREHALRRQLEPQSDIRLSGDTATIADPGFPDHDMPCFPIARIALRGDAAEHFQFALQPVVSGSDSAIGRCLGVQGINTVMSRVQNAVISAGYVTTRILSAPQDLGSGVLTLTVMPGKIRAIRFADDADPLGTQWNALPVAPGALLNLRAIEQGLENLKRVPTADVDLQITPSQTADTQPGDSDLIISYQQAFPFRLTVSLDDGGAKSTGKYQGGLTLSYDNWWTLNDLFYFSFNHDLGGSNHGDHGAHGHTMHYSLPFGYWQLGLTQSANQYHQEVAGFSQTYRYHGKSENTELKLTRLLWRNATHKTSISLKGLLRSASNYIDDTEVSPQRRRTTAWELSLQHRIFIQRASVEGALSYRHGTGAFGALRAPEEDFNEGTSRFRIITTDLALTAPFALNLPWGAQTLRYNGTVRAQWNETPLTPQDRFTIGGRYSVRGFDGEYVLAAERGWLVRNELSAALGSSGQEFYLGADYGEVAGRSAALLLGTRLAGAVAGMRGVIGGFAWDGFAGAPLHRPEGFKSAAVSAGFTLNWTF